MPRADAAYGGNLLRFALAHSSPSFPVVTELLTGRLLRVNLFLPTFPYFLSSKEVHGLIVLRAVKQLGVILACHGAVGSLMFECAEILSRLVVEIHQVFDVLVRSDV